MTELYIALGALGALLVAFIAILLIRTAMFKPKKQEAVSCETVIVDGEKAVRDLADMIRCRTISDKNKENENEEEFDKFKSLLPTLFPTVYEKCTVEHPSDRSILILWQGQSHDAPTVLMSHFDVVSVVEEDWEKPPFDGILENGLLWGRGTLDTKGTLNGILQAAEGLMKSGFVPKADVYFAFGGDEEINGYGARSIVALFQERGIVPSLVLDEGGAVVEKVFPGVTKPCALIGIAEKGMLNAQYTIKTAGGHASSPAPHTPVGRLSAACVRVENHPFKFRITKPARAMFDTLGRHSSFLYRMIFANLWCFSPILDLLTKKTGGELNALMRTTVAFTQMEGSKGMNVIPPMARMVSNSRLLEGETVESAVAYLQKTVGDPDITVTAIEGTNPSVISRTDSEGWKRVCAATAATWQDAIVSPYLMVACSDACNWGVISDNVYRFSAMALSKEERSTIHGNNEKVPVGTIVKTVEFYVRLLRNS